MEWSDVVVSNIEEIIKRKGYLQKAVAARAGIPEKTFNNSILPPWVAANAHVRAG